MWQKVHLNQAKINKAIPSISEPRPCLKWTTVEPVTYPGKYGGNEPAGLSQYMTAITTKTIPSITAR